MPRKLNQLGPAERIALGFEGIADQRDVAEDGGLGRISVILVLNNAAQR